MHEGDSHLSRSPKPLAANQLGSHPEALSQPLTKCRAALTRSFRRSPLEYYSASFSVLVGRSSARCVGINNWCRLAAWGVPLAARLPVLVSLYALLMNSVRVRIKHGLASSLWHPYSTMIATKLYSVAHVRRSILKPVSACGPLRRDSF